MPEDRPSRPISLDHFLLPRDLNRRSSKFKMPV